MVFNLQKMTYNTKDTILKVDRDNYDIKHREGYGRMLLLKLGCMLIIAFVLVCMQTNQAQAASSLKIYNYTTKKTINYTGKQVKVLYNGRQISKDSTPGILQDGIALVPYTDLFNKSGGIYADVKYDSSKGTITITKNNITIKMTLKSKSATVNGKKVTMPLAPVQIKYGAVKVTKILIPSRFVIENLGMKYTWYSSKNTIEIVSSGLSLSYNNGEPFEYKGTQGAVTIDGKSVDLEGMPSVIINNTAMLYAKKVYAQSKIKAEYTYSSDTQTVTLKKDNNELLMTIGSKIAYLNGKKVTLQQGPILVNNYELNTSFVMVPGQFTTTSLGYDYNWNKSQATSQITTKKNVATKPSDSTEDGTNNTSAPELGDDSVIIEQGTVLAQWQAMSNIIGSSSGIHTIDTGSVAANRGSLYYITRDYNNQKLNSETFVIVGNQPMNQVTSSSAGQTITIQLPNMECFPQTYQTYGSTSNYINMITTENTQDSGTQVSFQVLPEDYSYDIYTSPDQNSLYVTIYQRTLSSAVIGTNSSGDYITLTGANPKKINITMQDQFLYIDLLHTTNGLGDQQPAITGAKGLNAVYLFGLADRTQLILQLKEGYEYYTSSVDNKLNIIISPISGTIPVEPTNPSTTIPTTPSDDDLSKYEITIPKPEGISNEMILHEDYYYDNQFAIKIPGDYTGFYASNNVMVNSKVVTGIKVLLNKNNETEILFTTSKLQGYKFAVKDNYIYVKIGNPKDIYKNIVVLDPGHGGGAVGAHYFNTYEKNLNYKILYTLGKKYFESNPWELKVYYTRTGDYDRTLDYRAGFASKVGADLFVSLHMNASTAKTANGTEVYYSTSNNSPNKAGLTSKKLAEIYVKKMSNVMGTKNRGAVAARYTVVHKNTVPAILIELGFLSNENDFALISNEVYQEKAVRTIYETLLEIFKDYPTGRK